MTPTVPAPLPPHLIALVDQLHARDGDPEYAGAPVLDVYGRISKNPETGETEKVDRQLEDCLRDLLRRRARLGRVLRDDGISAWRLTAKRRGWDELVRRLETREAAGVIAWHTDRLMRQPRDLERLIGFGDAGLLVGSCHGDYDLADADDRFTLRIHTAAAAKDSDNTSRRQKRKAAAKREKGFRSGGPRAFGEPGTYRRVGVTGEQLAVEREAIAWAARAHLDGVSIRAIAREWNERGLRTVSGREWDPRFVVQILKSPRIAGLLVHGEAVVGRMKYMEPIISTEEHEALVSVFTARRKGRPTSEAYLLSGGLLICGKCEHPLTGRATKVRGESVRRYACRGRGGGCGLVVVYAGPVDEFIANEVPRRLADPRRQRALTRSSKELGKVRAQLEQANATARELSRRLGEGGISLERYDAAIAPLDRRFATLRAQENALEALGGPDGEGTPSDVEDFARQWVDADIAGRRLMVRRAYPWGIEVLPARAGNQYTQKPVDRLAARYPER